jgi:hypothetical protein
MGWPNGADSFMKPAFAMRPMEAAMDYRIAVIAFLRLRQHAIA